MKKIKHEKKSLRRLQSTVLLLFIVNYTASMMKNKLCCICPHPGIPTVWLGTETIRRWVSSLEKGSWDKSTNNKTIHMHTHLKKHTWESEHRKNSKGKKQKSLVLMRDFLRGKINWELKKVMAKHVFFSILHCFPRPRDAPTVLL